MTTVAPRQFARFSFIAAHFVCGGWWPVQKPIMAANEREPTIPAYRFETRRKPPSSPHSVP
jgi:hypothetical protein